MAIQAQCSSTWSKVWCGSIKVTFLTFESSCLYFPRYSYAKKTFPIVFQGQCRRRIYSDVERGEGLLPSQFHAPRTLSLDFEGHGNRILWTPWHICSDFRAMLDWNKSLIFKEMQVIKQEGTSLGEYFWSSWQSHNHLLFLTQWVETLKEPQYILHISANCACCVLSRNHRMLNFYVVSLG